MAPSTGVHCTLYSTWPVFILRPESLHKAQTLLPLAASDPKYSGQHVYYSPSLLLESGFCVFPIHSLDSWHAAGLYHHYMPCALSNTLYVRAKKYMSTCLAKAPFIIWIIVCMCAWFVLIFFAHTWICYKNNLK